MSADITIGVELKLVGESERTIARLNELSRTLQALSGVSTGATKRMEEIGKGAIRIGDEVVKLADIFEHFRRAIPKDDVKRLNEGLRAARAYIRASRLEWALSDLAVEKYSRSLGNLLFTGQATEDQIKSLAAELENFKVEGQFSAQMLNILSKGFRKAGLSVPITVLQEMAQRLNYNTEAIIKWANEFIQSQRKVATSLWMIQNVNRRVLATLGPTRMALLQLGQTMFWMGLGTMFFYMSLARLHRSFLSVRSAQLSLLRATVRLAEIRERYNRLVNAGITSGRQFQETYIDLREAELAVALAEERLRITTINQMFAWAMLAFGTLPTLIRSTSDLFLNLLRLNYAQVEEGKTAWQAMVSLIAEKAAMDSATVSTEAFSIALKEAATTTIFLTAGLTALTLGLSFLISKLMIDRQMRRVREEMEKLGLALTQPHSPSLIEGLERMAESLGKISRRVGPLLPTVGRSMFGLTGVLLGPSVVVNVSGPFYVRSEEDIRGIARAIAKELRTRGVYT